MPLSCHQPVADSWGEAPTRGATDRRDTLMTGFVGLLAGSLVAVLTVALLVRSWSTVKKYGKMDWRDVSRAEAVDRTAARLSIMQEAQERVADSKVKDGSDTFGF